MPFAGFGLLLPWCNRLLPSSPNAVAWLLDLAAHWQILYASAWLALCALAALRAKRWLLLSPFALLPLLTASPALPVSETGEPALRVAVANVHLSNRDPARLVAWLRTNPADVVAINELTPAYAEALADAIGDLYPHREFVPDDSPFGIGLMSRLPLTDIDLQRSDFGIPALSARVDVQGRTVRVVAVHPVPPMQIRWHDERNRLLQSLAVASADDTSLVVAGDLNATPWSMALTGIARVGDVDGLRRSTGLGATWSHRVFGLPIGIPIDHVLAGRDWRRGAATIGPEIGSDHRPIRIDLHWADTKRAK